MAITESEHPRSATTGHSAHNADSARWAGVSIAAMSVRRFSGSAWAALSGPGIHRGAAGNVGGTVLRCRIWLWLGIEAGRPSCSGKHRKHGMRLHVIASPAGDILRVSGALPGAGGGRPGHPGGQGLPGSAYAKIPAHGGNKPQSQEEANRVHARLRVPGDRG
jgi:hypothetical protein